VHLPGDHHPIANLFHYDFRMSGSKQLIAVDASGRVAGYSVSKDLARLEEAINSQDKVVSDDILKMGKEKIDLQNKLDEMEQRKQDEKEMASMPEHQRPPAEEEIQITRRHNIENKCSELVVTINKPGWVIRSVILYSDAFFKGGSYVVHPS